MEPDFPNFFLNLDFQDSKIKLQTKELNKMADMADEELEKSIDDQKSVNTCRSKRLTDHSN